MEYDVIIVGAGPAGATAAYQLAKVGVKVLLVEKYPLPRYKTCGGAITFKTTKLLDFDISSVVERTIHRVSITSQLEKTFIRSDNKPLCYLVMRNQFDHLLIQQAQKAGAKILDHYSVQHINMETDRVTIQSKNSENFSGKIVVGADGAHSIVARSLGLKTSTHLGIALESEIEVQDKILSDWQDMLLLDLGFIRNGYGWIFPKKNHLSIGVGSWPQNPKGVKKYYAAFDKFCRSKFGSYRVLHTQGHPLPLRLENLPIHRGRSLLIGDAAGLINPLDGEGIYYAIKSAQLAVPYILKNLDNQKIPDFSGYQQTVDEILMPEFRSALKLLWLYNLAPGLVSRGLEKYHWQWNWTCQLMRGELKYTDILKKLGPVKFLLPSTH